MRCLFAHKFNWEKRRTALFLSSYIYVGVLPHRTLYGLVSGSVNCMNFSNYHIVRLIQNNCDRKSRRLTPSNSLLLWFFLCCFRIIFNTWQSASGRMRHKINKTNKEREGASKWVSDGDKWQTAHTQFTKRSTKKNKKTRKIMIRIKEYKRRRKSK